MNFAKKVFCNLKKTLICNGYAPTHEEAAAVPECICTSKNVGKKWQLQ